MTEDIRRRSACDRCHAHKLRCPRRPGVAVCDRCLKARKSCVYSPFRQKKGSGFERGDFRSVLENRVDLTKDDANLSKNVNCDPRNAANRKKDSPELRENTLDPSLMFDCSSTQIDAAVADGMNLDYPFSVTQGFSNDCAFDDLGLNIQSPYSPFNFSPMSPLFRDEGDPKRISIQRFESPPPPTPPEPKSNRLLDHNLVVIPELTIYQNMPLAISWKFKAEHAVDLESSSKCIRRLSELSIKLYEHDSTIPPMTIHNPDTLEDELERAINPPPNYRLDESFHLTQEMIDIYPSILSLCSSRQQDGPAKEPAPLPTIDHSSVLLALSCHLRLIGIYDKLFEHMNKCVESRKQGTPPNKKQVDLMAPTLRVGSFAPPQSSAVPMQLLLLIQLAFQLSNYASDLVAQLRSLNSEDLMDGDRINESNRVAFSLALAGAENVMGKAHNMAQQMSVIRNHLLDNGLLA